MTDHKPHFGHTKLGLPVHHSHLDYHDASTAYARFNKKVAVKVTAWVGSMTCAYIFTLLALCSLPAVLSAFPVFAGLFPLWMIKPSLIALIAWIAQTFLQLVLLSVIMVGQLVQQLASDARAAKQFEDTEVIVDRLDLKTEGGIAELHKQLSDISDRLGKSERIV